ncbi:MAG: hypothetical protein J07HX64_01362 [halophilic archaeon J07HX64]|nr:MAG: hypothetical protein J07HX64_01362 [halophilic archaeon J07HX64]
MWYRTETGSASVAGNWSAGRLEQFLQVVAHVNDSLVPVGLFFGG